MLRETDVGAQGVRGAGGLSGAPPGQGPRLCGLRGGERAQLSHTEEDRGAPDRLRSGVQPAVRPVLAGLRCQPS